MGRADRRASSAEPRIAAPVVGDDPTVRRRRIDDTYRDSPGADPPVEQQDEELSSSARTHLRTLHGQDLARPAGTGGGIVFVLLVAIAALIVLTALAATGHL